MDRTIVYPGALPQDTDILAPQRNVMVALGFLIRATFGTGAFADGLACGPTGPASMSIVIGQGSLAQLMTVDATVYGSIGSDTSDNLVKMGINLGSTSMGPFTAPGSAGQSQNFLIQGAVSETDGSATVLPYYNASSPSTPYAGPGGLGSAQNTKRTQTVNLQIKAGASATTGSQTTPTPDSGYVGLWVITIANGQVTITAGDITTYVNAPFITTKLPSLRRRLTNDLSLYVNGVTGFDGNNGLAPAAAMATLNGAWALIVNTLDLNGFKITVHVSDANYAPATFSGNPIGATSSIAVTFVGNVSSPANCTIAAVNASAFTLSAGAQVLLQGFKVSATGTGAGQGYGIYVSSAGCFATIGDGMAFDACDGSHISAVSGGEAVPNGNYSITGDSPSHYNGIANGIVVPGNASQTVTLIGTRTFSTAFAVSTDGCISSGPVTFTGTAIGSRYLADVNGTINTNGGGASFFPGNAVGTTARGGQYV